MGWRKMKRGQLLSLGTAGLVAILCTLAAGAEESIDPLRGRLILSETDLSLRAGAVELALTRSWVGSEQEMPGLLGAGWQLNWEATDAIDDRIHLTRSVDGRLVRIDGPHGQSIVMESDDQGRITLATGSTGDQVRWSYTGGQLAFVAVNGGPPTSYAYDLDGRLEVIDDPRAGRVRIIYDDEGRVSGRRWADGAEERYEYDPLTQMIRHTDPLGALTSIRWDPEARREERIDPLGNRTVIEYDEGGRVRALTDPIGDVTRLTYDAQGRLLSMTGCCSGIRTLEFEGAGDRVAAITFADGSRQTFGYDDQGRLLSVHEGDAPLRVYTYTEEGLVASLSEGGRLPRRFTYDASGRLTSETNAAGEMIQFQYDERGNLVRRISLLGATTEWTYDALGRVISEIDPAGGRTAYAYDERGFLSEITGPEGGTWRYDYDPRGRLTAETDPSGRTIRYTYDAAGRTIQVTDPAGNATEYAYDAAGRLIREINPLGGIVQASHDPLGRLRLMTDPAGGSLRYEHTPEGLVSRLTGPSGEVTHYEYDAAGRLTSAGISSERATRYRHDDHGRIVEIRQPGGLITTQEYDTAGDLSEISDNRGFAARFTRDLLGRVLQVRYASGWSIAYQYDVDGRLVATSDNQGSEISARYDARGVLVATTDATGALTRFAYDRVGRPVGITDSLGQRRRISYAASGDVSEVVEANGDAARFDYDAAGHLTRITHPGGGVTTLLRDAMGNVTAVRDPLGHESRYAYDRAGRLVSAADARGLTIVYNRDVAGRPVQKSLGDGRLISYTYNPAGDLAAVTDGSFAIHYEYNPAGLLTRVTYPALEWTLTYGYDSTGRRVRRVDSDGTEVGYEYDTHGHLQALRLPDRSAIGFGYDPRGRLVETTYPNGVRSRREYDAAGRLAALTYADAAGDELTGWRYVYDGAGNLKRTTRIDGMAIAYRHDPSGQLVSEDRPSGTIRYDYRPGGNRGGWGNGDQSIRYQYDAADRLIQAADDVLSYDAAGHLIGRRGPSGDVRYGYDAEGNLEEATLSDGRRIAFGYAPTGERIWRESADGRRYRVTDGRNRLADLDASRRVTARYVHAPGFDRPVAMLRADEIYFFHPDAVGTPVLITDASGGVVATLETDAFGRILSRTGDVGSPFGFTGREYDEDLDLYDFRARFYDPNLGRFLSPDPAWDPTRGVLALNRYAYALNNPTRYTDPLGLMEIPRGFTPNEARQLHNLRMQIEYEHNMHNMDFDYIQQNVEDAMWLQRNRAPGEGFDILRAQYQEQLTAARNWRQNGPRIIDEWMNPPRQPGPITRAMQRMDTFEGRGFDPDYPRAGRGDPTRAYAAGGPPRIDPSRQPSLNRAPTLRGDPATGGVGGPTRIQRPGPTRVQPGQMRPPGQQTRIQRPPSSPPNPSAPNPGLQAINRVGGGVATGLGAAATYYDYHACRDAGFSRTECAKRTILALTAGVAAGYITAQAALAAGAALGIGAPAVATALIAAGLLAGADAAWDAGQRWANAPEHLAQQYQGRTRRDLISRADDIAAGLEARAEAMWQLHSQAVSTCQEAQRQSELVTQLKGEIDAARLEIEGLVPQIQAGFADCGTAGAPIAEIERLRSRVAGMEETVLTALDGAEGIAADCQTPEDAAEIRELYNTARRLAVQMDQDVRAAIARNQATEQNAERVQATQALLELAQGRAESMLTTLGALGTAVAACQTHVDNARTQAAQAESRRAALNQSIGTLLGTLDGGARENEDAAALSALVSRLRGIRSGARADRYLATCDPDAIDQGANVTAKLDAEAEVSAAEALIQTAETASIPCAGILTQAEALEAMSASAQLALLNVAGRENLLERADLCDGGQGETGGGLDDLDAAIDDVAGDGLADVASLLALFWGAVDEERELWDAFISYADAFEQRVREMGADACDDGEVAYNLVQARDISQQHEGAVADLVDAYAYLQGVIDQLGDDRAPVSEAYFLATSRNIQMRSRYQAMLGTLSTDYGCDDDELERQGEDVAESGADPDDIDAGVAGNDPTALEICGDGIDNDGDNEIDECDAGCCEGRTVVVVSDCGSAADDIFLARLDNGASGVTPRGASTTFSTDLSPGIHTITLQVLSAPDDIGTYCVTVSVDGVNVLSFQGSPAEGTTVTESFVVPQPGPALIYRVIPTVLTIDPSRMRE